MDNDLANKINDIKTAVEYESKFSKEHRDWMVDTVTEIKDDVKKINSRVRNNEIQLGWMKGIVAMITAGLGWLIGKEI
jgi:hypothetical protein|tara:strand:- start:299 stop:532 length:234 start_codon:yes stop_codon:yes gene_type:complete